MISITHGIGLGGLFLVSFFAIAEPLTRSLDGEALAFEAAQGNCLACHHIPGGEQMGDIGPPLENMRARFPRRQRLYDQIWDASAFNIHTMMPPYGRQEILSSREINAIIDFLYQK